MRMSGVEISLDGGKTVTGWDFGAVGGDYTAVSFFGGAAGGGKTIMMRTATARLSWLGICQAPKEPETGSPLARANALKSSRRQSLDAKLGVKPYG